MEQISSSSLESEEIPSILRNPDVHYGVHNSPSLVAILSQINQIHTLPSYFFKTYLYIRFPSTFRSFKMAVSVCICDLRSSVILRGIVW
jgi:hypothetical protein